RRSCCHAASHSRSDTTGGFFIPVVISSLLWRRLLVPNLRRLPYSSYIMPLGARQAEQESDPIDSRPLTSRQACGPCRLKTQNQNVDALLAGRKSGVRPTAAVSCGLCCVLGAQ